MDVVLGTLHTNIFAVSDWLYVRSVCFVGCQTFIFLYKCEEDSK